MERDELAAWLRLTLTPGAGNGSARKLLAAFGLPQAIFQQSITALQQIVSTTQALTLCTEPAQLAKLIQVTWAWLQQDADQGIRRQIVTLGDPLYPQALLNLDDPPLILYLMGKGTLKKNSSLPLSDVGSTTTDSIANSLF